MYIVLDWYDYKIPSILIKTWRLCFDKITWPYAWHPSIVETQLFRIGQLLIAAVPGEFTTMAGRRLREALNAEAVNSGGPSNTKTVIAGLSNVYSHYVTTYEEYQVYQKKKVTCSHFEKLQ